MLFLLAYWYLVYVCLVLSIYTAGFVLFLLAYRCILVLGIYIYAWFCAILTSIYTLGFVLFLLAYWHLISIYLRLVLCYSYLPIGTSIYIYIYIRLVLCYSYYTCILVLSIYTVKKEVCIAHQIASTPIV